MSVIQRRTTAPAKTLLRDGVPDLGLGRASDSDEDDADAREHGRPQQRPAESSLARVWAAQDRAAAETRWMLCAGVTWLAVLLLVGASSAARVGSDRPVQQSTDASAEPGQRVAAVAVLLTRSQAPKPPPQRHGGARGGSAV